MRTRFIYNSLHAAFLLVGQMRLQCPGMRSGVVVMAALTAALLMSMPARSDYAAGQEAWEAGRIAEALSEWEAAAAEGDVRAMMTLGRAYQRGVGAPQDYILAHFWFNLAASQDDFRAAAERDSLAELMSVEEKAAARKLLREWRGKVQPTVEVDVSDQAPSATAPDVGTPPPRAIKEAQSLLAQLGYAPGPADGIWGKRTSEAYRAFLGDAELPVTETLTPKALRILREISARQGEAEQPEQTVKTQIPADALHRAAKAGDLDGLNAYLEAGADVNARDRQSWTALMHAANKGYTLLVPALLKAEADPDVQAADGATALFMAAVHGYSEIIVLLMNAGADFSILGPTDRTAADVARVKYGGLHAAQRNNERAEVLALMQEGQPMPGELAESIERSKLKLKEILLKCESSNGFRASSGATPSRRLVQILDVEFAGSEITLIAGTQLIYGGYRYEHDSEALVRGRYYQITTYVFDIKSVSVHVERNRINQAPFDDGHVNPSHTILIGPIPYVLEEAKPVSFPPSSETPVYTYQKSISKLDYFLTHCKKDEVVSIAKEFSNIQDLLKNL